MHGKLISSDQHHGTMTFLKVDMHEKGNEVQLKTFQSRQVVQNLLDVNREKREAGASYYKRDNEMWPAASIPALVQLEWMEKYGITDLASEEHWPKIRQLLNSNEYQHLKVANIVI